MRPFNHLNATTLEEAAQALRQGGAVALAGGGDLLGALKDDIFPVYPKTVVNLKSIPGLTGIGTEGGALVLGALTTLADLARSPLVAQHAPGLGLAAGKASSPSLRETTTLGGNLCQLPRCWYFRKLRNRFDCARKGGRRCFALSGDDRYHSCFGGAAFETPAGEKRTCIAVNQGELAPVLTVMGAQLVTTERTLDVGSFFGVGVLSSTVLRPGELLTQVRVPISDFSRSCRYQRFAFRKSIEFPVLNLAIAVDGARHYRICLGGAAPCPYRAEKAEALLAGREITPALAAEAGLAAVDGAKPSQANAYKVQLIKTLVKRQLLAL